ncbi:hypothetical protein K493DRAFT_288751 [Basidiobolus meristosporus CBS 931.73]|uniref:Pirin-like protein n=1 Tax=Basidiobolus meristosporus CBS 931.73 TaxID=1314790 RepID=A0A1Y1XVX7_9FUNG|nr:hypothetical protein K493DRAFT_294970 [Basidiobolus meristosporus CBS 931.73]ORX89897.1 hypothetical protein K493DRAFT_288751 [Basidiobolus meristosporus CBS 931.73]|eukprot:ORX63245.1 hypothetical protein K493DRAFT_294970 [Basidiobolus meristosporus CBS 931.73]
MGIIPSVDQSAIPNMVYLPMDPTDTLMAAQRYVTSQVEAIAQSEGDGATVRRSIGTSELENFDPFLMLDEFMVEPPAGFPDHPHRGFETVTYMLEGIVAHEDFAGHKGEIGPGDLQWMTAGRGIVHAEMPQTKCRGLQLWVNLSATEKMCEPRYQELLDKEIPRVSPPGVDAVIKVIAGHSFGVSSPVVTKTPTMYLDFKVEKNSKFEQVIPESYQGFLYILEGEGYFGSKNTLGKAHHTLTLSEEGGSVSIETKDSGVHFVLVAGEPIKEPVVQYGPFVMNHSSDIQRTFIDYRMGMNGFERARTWRSEIGNRR